jgi:predicted N-acetyltransferase YhbS
MTPFHCRDIIDSDWRAILRIQREVYYEITPESEAVMRSKAVHGLHTSFVAVDQRFAVIAYCLAHPYPSNQVAVLGTADASEPEPTNNLYLHDLAVQNASAGRGVAQILFDHLTSVARLTGYRTMSLVAVQQAAGFWTKMGFRPSKIGKINGSYTGNATFMTRRL